MTIVSSLVALGLAIGVKKYFSKNPKSIGIPDNGQRPEVGYTKAMLLSASIHQMAVAQLMMYSIFIVFLLPIWIIPSSLPSSFFIAFLITMGITVTLIYAGITLASFVKCDQCGKRMLFQGFVQPKYLYPSTKQNFVKGLYRFRKTRKHTCIYCGQKYSAQVR